MGFSVTYIEENVGSVPRMLGRPGKIQLDENQLLFLFGTEIRRWQYTFLGVLVQHKKSDLIVLS